MKIKLNPFTKEKEYIQELISLESEVQRKIHQSSNRKLYTVTEEEEVKVANIFV